MTHIVGCAITNPSLTVLYLNLESVSLNAIDQSCFTRFRLTFRYCGTIAGLTEPKDVKATPAVVFSSSFKHYGMTKFQLKQMSFLISDEAFLSVSAN